MLDIKSSESVERILYNPYFILINKLIKIQMVISKKQTVTRFFSGLTRNQHGESERNPTVDNKRSY